MVLNWMAENQELVGLLAGTVAAAGVGATKKIGGTRFKLFKRTCIAVHTFLGILVEEFEKEEALAQKPPTE